MKAPDLRPVQSLAGYCARALAVGLVTASLCTVPLYSQNQAASSAPSSNPSDPGDTPTFKKDVKVVNVFATVRDKHGQIVPSLAKDDFLLQVDGRPEAIRYFARETDLPLTLGLLVDTSLSQRRVLEEERTASFEFLNDVMREDRDKAFVINFDAESVLLQDLTNSKPKLETALDRVHVGEPDQNGGQGGRGGGGYPGGGYPSGGHGNGGWHRPAGTTLYDAVFLASDELMRRQQGRKALILLTDGVDQGSKYTLERAIEAAQRSDTMVYSILFADPEAYNRGMAGYPGGHHGGWNGPWGGPAGPPMGGPRYPAPPMESHADGRRVLQRLSQETGGHFFEVSKKESVAAIYKQVQDELRNQYSLGFSPETAQQSTGYHKILLAAKPKDLVVQTRQGYYEAR